MGYDDSQYEETIDLKDLCIFALRKWKLLVVAMLISALLFGIYKTVSILQPFAAADTVPMSTSDTDAANTEQREANATEISTNRAEIAANEEQIAANEKTIGDDQARIEMQEAAIAESERVVEVYEQALEEALSLLETELPDETRVSLIAEVSGLTDNVARANADIRSANEEIRVCRNEAESLEAAVQSLQGRNTALQERNIVLADENNRLEAELAESQSGGRRELRSIFKMVILGAAMGCFVVCGYLFLQYFLYKYIRNARELTERYGYYILGDLHRPARQKRDKINRLLDQWAGYAKKTDPAEEYPLIAARIQMAVGDTAQPIMITGTIEPALLVQVCQRVRELLPEKQYSICAKSNLTYNAEALKHVRQYMVVLVEKAEVSEKREVAKLVEVIQISKVNVVGVVML